ncbi:hypothetical protein OV079_51370 [Nannocystis pusilla]|uniref:Uncharacterized protein n=1 Tax=Nannocystis pusilla TaxID=889268 RepID=A0A9X3F0K2_9BACT|nr:hypothetical protein [Nannocystis pusilla]MCY1013793.1 hypothetical protein [Nannocystis pusilla]
MLQERPARRVELAGALPGLAEHLGEGVARQDPHRVGHGEPPRQHEAGAGVEHLGDHELRPPPSQATNWPGSSTSAGIDQVSVIAAAVLLRPSAGALVERDHAPVPRDRWRRRLAVLQRVHQLRHAELLGRDVGEREVLAGPGAGQAALVEGAAGDVDDLDGLRNVDAADVRPDPARLDLVAGVRGVELIGDGVAGGLAQVVEAVALVELTGQLLRRQAVASVSAAPMSAPTGGSSSTRVTVSVSTSAESSLSSISRRRRRTPRRRAWRLAAVNIAMLCGEPPTMTEGQPAVIWPPCEDGSVLRGVAEVDEHRRRAVLDAVGRPTGKQTTLSLYPAPRARSDDDVGAAAEDRPADVRHRPGLHLGTAVHITNTCGVGHARRSSCPALARAAEAL